MSSKNNVEFLKLFFKLLNKESSPIDITWKIVPDYRPSGSENAEKKKGPAYSALSIGYDITIAVKKQVINGNLTTPSRNVLF